MISSHYRPNSSKSIHAQFCQEAHWCIRITTYPLLTTTMVIVSNTLLLISRTIDFSPFYWPFVMVLLIISRTPRCECKEDTHICPFYIPYNKCHFPNLLTKNLLVRTYIPMDVPEPAHVLSPFDGPSVPSLRDVDSTSKEYTRSLLTDIMAWYLSYRSCTINLFFPTYSNMVQPPYCR